MTQRQITRAAVSEALSLLLIALWIAAREHMALPRLAPGWQGRALATFFAAGFGGAMGLQIGLTAARAAGLPL